MIRLKRLVPLLVLVYGAGVLPGPAHAGRFEDDPIASVARAAVELDGAVATRIHYADGDTFRLVDIFEGSNGNKVVTFERRHLGILVLGDVVRLIYKPDGTLDWAASTISEPLRITDVAPQASHVDAEKKALSSFPYGHGKLREPAQQVINALTGDTPTLAWSVRIDGSRADGTPSHMVILVSSDGKTILGSSDDVQTAG